MASKMLKGRYGDLKPLSTEVDRVEPVVTTLALVDSVVTRTSTLADKLQRLGDALKSVGETGDLKNESRPAGLNGKLENAARNLEFTDIILQDVADYLGVEI